MTGCIYHELAKQELREREAAAELQEDGRIPGGRLGTPVCSKNAEVPLRFRSSWAIL